MKQICTLLALVCLLVITQNVYAQNSVSTNTSAPSPAPTPSIGTPDSVNLVNGFTSTSTGTFNAFPKGKTATIISPTYYYPTDQSVIYFVYNLSTATSGSATTAPDVAIITATGDTLKATANSTLISGVAGLNYYFTFTLAAPLPANTNFKISVTMSVPNGDKTVTAQTFATNALKPTAKAPTPLPVKFSAFTAKKVYDAVSLTWTVGTEENVAGYEVQKSTDGNSFARIGFVAARGVSSYTYIDSKVNETAFYRVRSVDNDSKYIYSSILTLKGDQSDVVMKAFPSPVQSQLTVQHSSATGNGKIDVLSVDGRLFKSIALAAGTQQTSVDLSSAKAGIYIVRLITGNTIQSIKVTKQ
jgi:hypothetical protein